jgi:hypothetical protein
MDWIQVFTILLAVSGLFLWTRRESNQDSRELRAAIAALGNKLDAKLDNIRADMTTESRDFHGRLCSLEERMKEKKGQEH